MLHIALVQPEIPWNTGNIGRTSLCVGAQLHLVEPLGFSLSDREVKRAGLDYWPHVKPVMHQDYHAFMEALPALGQPFFLSTHGKQSFYDIALPQDCVLVFGREKGGLPQTMMERYRDQLFRLPMLSEHVRSINLSTSVGITAYEWLRVHGPKGVL